MGTGASNWGGTRHGTAAGASKHHYEGSEVCPACRAAKAKYDLNYASAPAAAQRRRDLAKAQQRARGRLVATFPDIYRIYYNEEKAKIAAEKKRGTA